MIIAALLTAGCTGLCEDYGIGIGAECPEEQGGDEGGGDPDELTVIAFESWPVGVSSLFTVNGWVGSAPVGAGHPEYDFVEISSEECPHLTETFPCGGTWSEPDAGDSCAMCYAAGVEPMPAVAAVGSNLRAMCQTKTPPEGSPGYRPASFAAAPLPASTSWPLDLVCGPTEISTGHENCLFAVRGKGRGLVQNRDVPSVHHAPRTEHSRKPASWYTDIVERVSPGPRLEMFARTPREGWDVMGNEVE